MADAKFSIGQINIVQHLLIVAREVANPAAIVATQSFAPPHPTSRNLIFNDLNPVNHYFDFRQSPDGVALGTLLATFSIDVGKITDVIVEIKEFVVDRGNEFDPDNGTNEYNNPNISGQSYVVLKPGYGSLSFEENIQDIPSGGFKYIDGQVFGTGERYTVIVFKKVLTQTTSSGRSFPEAIVDLPADVEIGDVHYNRLMEVSGAGPILVATFPDFTTIPDGVKFGFNTHRTSRTYLTLQFPPGAVCYVRGQAKNALHLGRGETIHLMKSGGELKISHWDGDYMRVGEIVYSEKAPVNGLQIIGGWKLRGEYPRFFEDHVNAIDPNYLGDAGPYPNPPSTQDRAKFCITLTHFWLPDHGGYFLRSTDPNGDVDIDGPAREPGSIQDSENKEHDHDINSDQDRKSGTNDDIVHLDRIGIHNPPPGTPYRTEKSGGSESRPKNVAENSYYII